MVTALQSGKHTLIHSIYCPFLHYYTLSISVYRKINVLTVSRSAYFRAYEADKPPSLPLQHRQSLSVNDREWPTLRLLCYVGLVDCSRTSRNF